MDSGKKIIFCYGASNFNHVINTQFKRLQDCWILDRLDYEVIDHTRKGDKFTRDRQKAIEKELQKFKPFKKDIVIIEMLVNLILGREKDDFQYSAEYIKEVAHRFITFVNRWAKVTNVIAFGIFLRRINRGKFPRKIRAII